MLQYFNVRRGEPLPLPKKRKRVPSGPFSPNTCNASLRGVPVKRWRYWFRDEEQSQTTSSQKDDQVEYEPEVEGVLFAQDDPLQNNVILSNIFSFLHYKDLKSVRQISTIWKTEADPYFKKSAILEIDQLSSQSGKTGKDFWAKVANLPCEHLKISGLDMKDADLSRVVETFGDRIKSLILVAADDTSVHEESKQKIKKNYFLQIAQQCPKLEGLELVNFPDYIIDDGFPSLLRSVMVNACPSLRSLSFVCGSYYCGLEAHFLMELLDFAPNVTHLSFSVEDDDALEEIFTAFEFRKAVIQNLESLIFSSSVGTTIYESQLQSLTSFEFRKLKKIVFGRVGENVEPATLQLLFDKMKGSLESFQLNETLFTVKRAAIK